MSSLEIGNSDACANAKNDLVDITEIITTCAASLTVTDPFLCDEASFNLHDAMAASQLADRKMDCCEIPISLVASYGEDIEDKDSVVFPRPIPNGLDGSFSPLKWDALTEQDALFISLEILVRLQSLLSGASVGESTFTCLYAHSSVLADMGDRLFGPILSDNNNFLRQTGNFEGKQPNGTIAQLAVFSSALALVESTVVVRGIIQNADIYEEEDFVCNTNQIPFFTEENSYVDSLQLIELAVDATQKKLQSEKNEITEALNMILCFQLGFLSIISTLAKLGAESLRVEVERMRDFARMTVNRLDKLLSVLDLLLSREGESDAVKQTLQQSFDSYINRPLVGNAPVRKVFFRETKDSVLLLRTITAELEWAVCDILLQGTSLGRIQRMLDRLVQCNVNILSRSLIILNLYFDEKVLGQYAVNELIVQNMRQWTHVPELFFSNEYAQTFLSRLAKPIYDTLKLRTLNKNRQRAYIEVVMLPEWISLQNEAHLVDAQFQVEKGEEMAGSPYFSQYVLTITIRLMERYVTSGIELGLFYNHEELSYACWYRDFLLSALLNYLTLMKQTKALEIANKAKKEATGRNNTKASRGKKKNIKHKNSVGGVNAENPDITAEDLEDDLELSVLGLKRNLCRGTIRFLAALRQAGVLQDNSYEFTSLERTFVERFEAFAGIRQPPPLSYQHFLEGSDYSRVKPAELFQTTIEWFQSCKKAVEQLLGPTFSAVNPSYAVMQEAEMRSLLKVCVGNSVYIQKLRQITQESASMKKKVEVDFDFSVHEQFCMIKLS